MKKYLNKSYNPSSSKKRGKTNRQLSGKDTRISAISGVISAKKGRNAVFTVGNMLGIALKDPNIRSIAGGLMNRYDFKLNTDGLRIGRNFLNTRLMRFKDEVERDSKSEELADCKRIVVGDPSKLAISKSIFGLYVLLVLAEHKKILAGQYIYQNSSFKCHPIYTFLSAGFADKHTSEIKSESKREYHKTKLSGKSHKKEGMRVAKQRDIAISTSIKGTPEQMAQLNEEILQGNKNNLFNKIEAKFQSQASQEGKVVKSVFFKTTNPYSFSSFSSQNSAKEKPQCTHHNQALFFFSTAKMGDIHYLYHYEGTSLKPGLVNGGHKSSGIEAYAEFVDPYELPLNYSR